MLRWPLSLSSPAGRGGRLSILIYHRVQPEADPLCDDVPGVGEFEARMRWVARWFNVMPLGQAVERLFDGTLPARALAITFDDGYADNEELAGPVLKRLGLCGTFFVSTGYLDGSTMWNDKVIESVRACRAEQLDLRDLDLARYSMRGTADRRAAIGGILKAIKHLAPGDRRDRTEEIAKRAGLAAMPRLMMRPEQVRSLRAMGMEIGGHTVTHPILTRLDRDQARCEMVDGKRQLESILDEPIGLFAYPNGVPGQDYAAEHVAMAREAGFRAAVSTAWGAASAASDRYQLPRFTPWDRTRLRFGLRMMNNFRVSEKRVS